MPEQRYDGDYTPRSGRQVRDYLQRFSHLNGLVLAATQDPIACVHALEERVLISRKPEMRGDRHVLLCASDTGGHNALVPLMDELMLDDRVAAVSLNASGAALSFFEKSRHWGQFQRIDQVLDNEGRKLPLAAKKGLLFDPAHTKAPPVSTVVVTGASYAGLENMWMLSAKGIFEAPRLVCVADTWLPFSPLSEIEKVSGEIDPTRLTDGIDAILCNDAIAQRVIEESLRSWERKPQVYPTGTGVLPMIGLEERATMRAAARTQFGIPDGNHVIALLGSYDREGDEVFRQLQRAVETIESLKIADLAILIRPHPSDPSAQKIASFICDRSNSNVRVMWAGKEVISMDHMRAVADFVISLDSTETIVAAQEGVPAAFLKIPGLSRQRYASYGMAIAVSQGKICQLSEPSSWHEFFQRRPHPTGDTANRDDIGKRMLEVVIGPDGSSA